MASLLSADLKVLVLAGSNPAATSVVRHGGDRELQPLVDKAFLPLRGRLVIEYVLDLLQECDLARLWVLAAERQLSRLSPRYRFTGVPQPPGGRFLESLDAASAALDARPDEPILVVFGDHPVTSPAALRLFLARCHALAGQADLIHALALQSSYREYRPWFRRTSVHIRGASGRASGFTLVVPSGLRHLAALAQLYDFRKLERLDSLLGLIRHVVRPLGVAAPRSLVDTLFVVAAKEMEKRSDGAGLPARAARVLEEWLTRRVSQPRLEAYAKRVLGARRGVRLIPIAHGGIAIDVDFEDEYAMLDAHWDDVQAVAARQDASLAQRAAAGPT